MGTKIKIFVLHRRLLTYLMLWPRSYLNNKINIILTSIFMIIMWMMPIPVFWAMFKVYEGVYDIKVFMETLIAVCNLMGYVAATVIFIRDRIAIEKLFNDINNFLKFCPYSLIKETDNTCKRYTKYLMIYVTSGLIANLTFPLITINRCKEERGFILLKNDPCGLGSRNYFPFDTSDPKIFWILYILESLCICHICSVFAVAVSVTIGLLSHTRALLKYCANKFSEIDYTKSEIVIKEAFITNVKFHQEIIEYTMRIFSMFSAFVGVYVMVNSFAVAIIGFQIVQNDSEDRFRFILLLLGWAMLLFLVCLYVQSVQDESLTIADAIYNSNWNDRLFDTSLRKSIIIVMIRSQRALSLKIPCFGVVSLAQFLAVMKTAYSVFTLLLTATDDNDNK